MSDANGAEGDRGIAALYHDHIAQAQRGMGRRASDLARDILFSALAEREADYDLFQVQRFLATYELFMAGQFLEQFLDPLTSLLARNELQAQSELKPLLRRELAKSDAGDILATAAVSRLRAFLFAYCREEFVTPPRLGRLRPLETALDLGVREELRESQARLLDFLEEHFNELGPFLELLFAKHMEMRDVFGRSLFAPLEERYVILSAQLGGRQRRFFPREFCQPFLAVVRRFLLGPARYDQINTYLTNHILQRLGAKRMTKHSFKLVYDYPPFKRHFANYLRYMLGKLSATEKRQGLVRQVNRELTHAHGGGLTLRFTGEHLELIMNAWRDMEKRNVKG